MYDERNRDWKKRIQQLMKKYQDAKKVDEEDERIRVALLAELEMSLKSRYENAKKESDDIAEQIRRIKQQIATLSEQERKAKIKFEQDEENMNKKYKKMLYEADRERNQIEEEFDFEREKILKEYEDEEAQRILGIKQMNSEILRIIT